MGESYGFKGYPEVIPNGVDIERFSQSQKVIKSVKSNVTGRRDRDNVAPVSKNGVDDLIRSPAHRRRIMFVIVGVEDRPRSACP